MKHLKLMLLALLAAPLLTTAQSSLTDAEPKSEEVTAKRILVIPFHPTRYYFSDCDKHLAHGSRMKREDVRYAFRASMDYASEQWLEKTMDPVNLFQLKDSISKSMMDQFYDRVGYAYDTPTRPLKSKKKNPLAKLREKMDADKKSSKKRSSKMDEDEDCYTTIEPEDEEYMKVIFRDKAFLDTLNSLYEPDFIVTINQFEIKTDFEKCIDREHGKFRRRIKVHYNVYRPDGKLVHGDVVTAKYNSTHHNFNKMVQDNFGILAEYIAASMP